MARLIRWIAVSILTLVTCASVRAEQNELTISPRWGTVWLSPRLTANWVILRYEHKFPKGSAPTGTVFLDLPAGVTCVSAVGMPFKHEPLDEGGTRVILSPVLLDNPGLQGGRLFLTTTLQPGLSVKGRIRAEWKEGKSSVTEFPIRIIDTPVARQPRKIMTGTAMWPYVINGWPGFYKQYASLGFNQMNYWHGAIDNIRKTITLYKGEEAYEIPLKFRERLHDALREKWKEKHQST